MVATKVEGKANTISIAIRIGVRRASPHVPEGQDMLTNLVETSRPKPARGQ